MKNVTVPTPNAKYKNYAPGKSENKTRRLNVSTPMEYQKDGKTETYWTNIGSAFETEKGMTVRLNALPLSGTLFISEPKEKTN